MDIKVAVLEDDPTLRKSYAELLESAQDMVLAWTASTVHAAMEALERAAPDVLLSDLGLPDGSGLRVIARAKRRYPQCEVMVISVFGDEDNVVAAIEAGAAGYLLKDTLPDAFLDTIRGLHAGGSPISPSIARILLNRARPALARGGARSGGEIELAERESQVLTLVAKGFNFNEIARMLGVSVNTVKTHVYRIYQKLSVHSRGEAVYEATKLGLLDL
jgi:DNA-binding NarL/FixJ family response regulator